MVRDIAQASDLPGAELVREGLRDLDAGRDTPAAALLQMATVRLGGVGVLVPGGIDGSVAGHRLYDLLFDQDRRTAHSRYNALVGRIVSYTRAYSRGVRRGRVIRLGRKSGSRLATKAAVSVVVSRGARQHH